MPYPLDLGRLGDLLQLTEGGRSDDMPFLSLDWNRLARFCLLLLLLCHHYDKVPATACWRVRDHGQSHVASVDGGHSRSAASQPTPRAGFLNCLTVGIWS